MTQDFQSRHDLLGAASGHPGIDAVLRRAVDAGEVPGVVALAANDRGVFYEGASGVRNLATGTPMTPNTVFRIASMTKAVTSVAALQLVEQGKLTLDGPVSDIDPALSAPQVLEGFDPSGAPRLRPARRLVTLRRLLTHTAGFSYEQWNANTARYVKATTMPSISSGKVASLRLPLAFDPGERWEYGVNIDWVGLIIEAVSGQTLDTYFQQHIFGPLGMGDTGFMPTPGQWARLVAVHQRQADGSLQPQPFETPFVPEFRGGSGLYSTASDYMAFLQALLHGGALGGARILRPETAAMLGQNQVGGIEAGILKTTAPGRSADVDFFPGASLKWSLATMINVEPGPDGRSARSLTWAGLFNTHYWIDPARRVVGVLMTQILPFGDAPAMRLFGGFERAVYDSLKTA